MDFLKIKKIIEEKSLSFEEGFNEEEIKKAEEELKVCFPYEYKFLLSNFGYLTFIGFEIFALGEDEKISCVSKTLFWREYGLPKDFIVISDSGSEWLECLDTGVDSNETNPVVAWYKFGEEAEPEAENLYEYISKQVSLYGDDVE